MGERDQFEQEPVPVVIVRRFGQLGVPKETLTRFLITNGIIKESEPESRGLFVEDFQVTFPLDCIISPIDRSTDTQSNTLGVAGNFVEVEITGLRNRVVVIRSLSWQTNFGAGAQTPDSTELRIRANQTSGLGPFLFQDGGIPASSRVIGDVTSPFTAAFATLLPIALVPADRLIFRQDRAVAAILGSEVTVFRELYQLPFRPAGL